MTIDDFSMLFQFIGGLGMFLYGMNLMSSALQKSAGNRMKEMMGVLTNSRFKGLLMGALVTAIIQSSGATTVMVVGFVNANIMSLTQAVGVIMGANIGTTITAWIVSAGQLGDVFAIMKPGFYAPLMVGTGAALLMFAKGAKKRTAGEILIALGLLFEGLDFMSSSIQPYTDSPLFTHAFTVLGSNPILGILAGMLVTALMQSSSASIGVLQTLAMTGMVDTNAAIYICLGANIGSTYTAILSSIGASTNAKRAALINLLFNCSGAVVFGLLSTGVFSLNPGLASSSIDSVHISIFHTTEKTLNTLLWFPLAPLLVKGAKMIIKDKEDEEKLPEKSAMEWHLDDRILKSPSFAIETTMKEVLMMGNLAAQNLNTAMEAAVNGDEAKVYQVFENEKKINIYEKRLTSYLIKINGLALTAPQYMVVKNMLYTINDLERVGDHADNIAELALSRIQGNQNFSDAAIAELNDIGQKAQTCIEYALKCRETGVMENYGRKVYRYEEEIDNLERRLRERHIQRLADNQCQVESGVIFLDMVSNLERVGDHAVNVVEYVEMELHEREKKKKTALPVDEPEALHQV